MSVTVLCRASTHAGVPPVPKLRGSALNALLRAQMKGGSGQGTETPEIQAQDCGMNLIKIMVNDGAEYGHFILPHRRPVCLSRTDLTSNIETHNIYPAAIFEDDEKKVNAASRQSKWEKLNAKAQLKWGHNWDKDKNEYHNLKAEAAAARKRRP